MISKSPRKQRKTLKNMPIHRKKNLFNVHLSEELRKQYGVRSLTVRKGDVVEVMRGSFKGHVNKVASVDRRKVLLHVEGITIAKSDEKQVARPLHPSNVMLTRLDVSDPMRKKKLDRLAKAAKERSK